jgi:hypothetical protein
MCNHEVAIASDGCGEGGAMPDDRIKRDIVIAASPGPAEGPP